MFLVCGESLMDVFALDATPHGVALDARVGGSPFNVAVGLARLCQPVSFLSSISTDALGERLLRALREEGVGTSTVQRSDAPTTLGLVGVNAAGVPGYAFYGHGGADRLLGQGALDTLPASVRAIHLGSYATVVEPVAATLRALVERERGRRLIAYDPNVRLNVEPDVRPWQVHLHWMMQRCHVLKVSAEDLQVLAPGTTPAAFAADALEAGVGLVVVTRGADGALAFSRRGAAAAGPVSVEVVDTVGAGDTFQAALLTWLAEHDALREGRHARLTQDELLDLLAFASMAAAITCSRRGADLPRRADLPAASPNTVAA